METPEQLAARLPFGCDKCDRRYETERSRRIHRNKNHATPKQLARREAYYARTSGDD